MTGGQDESGATINDTLTRNYLGSNVEVCHWNWTRASTSWNYFWLRDTGILAEEAENMTVVEPGAYYWEYLDVTITGYSSASALTGTITINPDGSITPSTANITTHDNVTYTFTGNNYLPIVVNRSNIIINGMGHTLQTYINDNRPPGIPPPLLLYYTIEFSLTSVSNVTIKNTTTTNNDQGVYLYNSSGNVLSGNNITANGFDGVDLYSCDNNTLSANNITSNDGGVILDSSSGNVFSGNNITGQGDGFDIWYSSGNVLSGNDVAGDGYDNGLSFYSSNSSIISGNIIANNVYGIVIYVSLSNSIYHNDFVDNTQQVSSDGSPNTWDNGYPSGGNYWSDYQTRYPSATEIDSSGIWNTPYFIDTNNTDYYPLVAPFSSFNVTWDGQTYPIDTVSNSTLSNFSFDVTTKTLSFDFTGTNSTVGFFRVAIPFSLMSGEWIVTVNGTQISYSTTTDSNNTYIYFTYHHSTEQVKIMSTSAVPEFQPSMLLPLFMIITLIGAMILKRKRNPKS